MQKLIFILFWTIFFFSSVRGQKNTVQQLSLNGIDQIFIMADEVFTIEVKTNRDKNLKIASFSEGIYADAIGITYEIKGNALYIHSMYPKILSSGYDKLSATKTFAMNLLVEIPQGKEVIVTSNLASVTAYGNYDFFEAELKSGNCVLKNFQGEAVVNTYSGNIYIETNRARLEVSSNNGTVKTPENFPIGKKITAKSIDGNIKVIKTQ